MKRVWILYAFFLTSISLGCDSQDLVSLDVTTFKLYAHADRAKNFEFQEDVIDNFNQQIRNPNLPFGASNGGVQAAVKYEAVFDNDQNLNYSGTLHFFQNKVLLTIYYPEDIGFPGDPCVLICLNNILGEDQLDELQKDFLLPDAKLRKWNEHENK